MLLKSVLTSLVGCAMASLANAANATAATIEVTGNAFFNSDTGDRFYIRGVDYQPGGSSNLTDPLADTNICLRDLPYFRKLGINTVRVYTVDNSLSHDDCMNAFADAGIYLILDVNTPDASINRNRPACSYNADYLQSVFATIDAFANYTNVLGFFAGNEVINDSNNTNSATYVKAVVRDMKNYIKARNYRTIPVGYSAADIVSNRVLIAEYLNCGNDSMARVDMFGINDYSWCGSSSFTVSGWSEKVKLYNGYSKPMFLSEFGCNEVVDSRPFSEIEALYNVEMTSVFSGGLVYEYTNETNNYGLVEIDNENNTVAELQDFINLQGEYNKTSNPTGDGGYSKSSDYSTCPTYEAGIWEANDTLPEMPSAASAYFKSGAGEPMGTILSTEGDCDAEYDLEVSSSMDATSSSEVSTSSIKTSSSSSSNSMSTATSTTTSSSRSRDSGNLNIQVPTIFKIANEIMNYII